MKRIRKIIAILITCMCMAEIANADSFCFFIESMNEGYNSDPVFKDDQVPHSKAMVSVTYNLSKMISEGVYQYSVIDATRRTNFIVIASNGIQISYAIELGYQETGYSQFYSPNHAGYVYLRGNATSSGTDYYVLGVWDPNCD